MKKLKFYFLFVLVGGLGICACADTQDRLNAHNALPLKGIQSVLLEPNLIADMKSQNAVDLNDIDKEMARRFTYLGIKPLHSYDVMPYQAARTPTAVCSVTVSRAYNLDDEYFINVGLRIDETARLVRDPKIKVPSTTWATSWVSQQPQHASDIASDIDAAFDKFAADYTLAQKLDYSGRLANGGKQARTARPVEDTQDEKTRNRT